VWKAEKLQAVAQSAICLGLESTGDMAAIASVLQILRALQKSLKEPLNKSNFKIAV